MTEIPEHLLQRSRERRAAMGGGEGGSSGSEGGEQQQESLAAPAKSEAQAPAPSMPAHPAPAEEPPPPPPSPMVEAYQKRRRIPYWAVPVLAMLPLWAYVYVGTLDPPPVSASPELLGSEEYAALGCGGCHGAGGGGGVGPAFAGGAIYETFPSFVEHFEWVRLGSSGWREARGDTYGATSKPVTQGMPGFPADSVDDAHLIYVVLHERTALGGANPDAEDDALLHEVANLLFENEGMTLEEALTELGAEDALAELELTSS